jgi:hypothetical protein
MKLRIEEGLKSSAETVVRDIMYTANSSASTILWDAKYIINSSRLFFGT